MNVLIDACGERLLMLHFWVFWERFTKLFFWQRNLTVTENRLRCCNS